MKTDGVDCIKRCASPTSQRIRARIDEGNVSTHNERWDGIFCPARDGARKKTEERESSAAFSIISSEETRLKAILSTPTKCAGAKIIIIKRMAEMPGRLLFCAL